MLNRDSKPFIPALRYNWLTRFYDPIAKLTTREQTFKRRLIQQVSIKTGQNILDLGCGTATLSLLVKSLHPETEVFGLDADAKVLELAQAKINYKGVNIELKQGMSFQLPYANESFNHVISSLLFHHLTREQKQQTLNEICRVLRPGGDLHIADAGKAHDWLMRIAFLTVQILDGFETTADNVNGLLPEFLKNAGFIEVEEFARYRTILGTLSLYKGMKPY